MTSKYFKPASVTWWTLGIIPLLSGVFIAFEPLHGLVGLSASIQAAAGMSAPALITIGLGGIGLRGAMG